MNSVEFAAAAAREAATGSNQVSELHVLQSLILPDISVCQELGLYVHRLHGAEIAYQASELRLIAGGRVSFASLYGGFSIGKWRKIAGIERLVLRLDVAGAGQVELWHWRAGHPRRMVLAADLPAIGPAEIEVPLSEYEDLDGIIAPEFVAWEPATIRGGSWLTPDVPRRHVRLGIVITSFRREAAVRATVRRLAAALGADGAIDASLVVVDNGRTLTPDDVPGATLIPNLNLGGSGGFARGLVHLQDAGGFTHAVFMDDDASTELESVRRALQLLSYAKDGATAIVSGLLFEEYPGIQLEAAGQMPRDAWIPARPGADLRRIEELVANELPFRVDYGGWWMFFFPLTGLRNLPFPFFLRGDDVEFPRANGFRLVTLNGIASYGPDFFRKESPVNVALDRRGNLVNVLLHGTVKDALRGAARGIQKGLMLANRYCYDHVDALCEGTRDVLAGPAAFEDLAGFTEGRRKEFSACVRQPRLTPLQVDEYPFIERRRHNWLWHLVRLVFFNGHLLPRFLLFRSEGILGTVWDSPGAEVFLRPRVVIREGIEGKGVLAERDAVRYFASMTRLTLLSLRLALAVPRLRREFSAARARFGSREYWDRQFIGGR